MRNVLLSLIVLIGGLAQAQIFITNWEVTDTSVSFFYQGAPGSFDPTAIDPSKLIVVWGSDLATAPPDPTYQIGRYAAGLVLPEADVEIYDFLG